MSISGFEVIYQLFLVKVQVFVEKGVALVPQ
jgi:hypothetical protein